MGSFSIAGTREARPRPVWQPEGKVKSFLYLASFFDWPIQSAERKPFLGFLSVPPSPPPRGSHLVSPAPRLRTPPSCDAGALPLGERSLGGCAAVDGGTDAAYGVPAFALAPARRTRCLGSLARCFWPLAAWPRSA